MKAPSQPAPSRGHLAVPAGLWLLTVVLVTLNLRPFLAAPGPLGQAIQASTGMDLRSFSWLTLLPMALMGIGGWIAPAALLRWGAARMVCASLLVVALGCAMRLAGASAALLIASSALCGAGVALVQSVMPGLVKSQSPHNVAPMMGLYSAALMGGGALGAQLSPLVMQWGGSWQLALALWAVPVLVALPLAWYALRRLSPVGQPAAVSPTTPAAGTTSPSTSASRLAPATSDTHWLMRRSRSWLLLLSFGLMNGGYASTVAWLAPFYQSHGWSATDSGSLVAILSIAQASAALTVPALAARNPDRRLWLVVVLLVQAIGFGVLAWLPDAAPRLNAVVLGAGLGGCFALYMVVALDHLPHPTQAGALNALMQGGGFLMAALAPWIVAQLLHFTGHWSAGWLYHTAVAVLVALLVLRFNPGRYAQVMAAPSAASTRRD